MSVPRLAVAAGLLAALVSGAPAAAQSAAGLVLEAHGAITPAVKPYTELGDGTTLALGSGARLVFAHYQTCKTITLVGGTVTVRPASYATRGGQQTEVATPCPRKVAIRGGGELGGVVFRSAAPRRSLTLPPEPVFVLAGARADAFVAARITRDRATIAEGPITDRVFRWPSGMPALPPDTAFELTLLPAGAREAAVSTRFATLTAADPASAERLVIITVE